MQGQRGFWDVEDRLKELSESDPLERLAKTVDFELFRSTLVAAPRQRNSDGEKVEIKAGRISKGWKDKPAKLRQKDRDARFTVKFSKAKTDEDSKAQQRDIAVPHFGPKNHIWIDRRYGIIRRHKVTDAAAIMAHGCSRG